MTSSPVDDLTGEAVRFETQAGRLRRPRLDHPEEGEEGVEMKIKTAEEFTASHVTIEIKAERAEMPELARRLFTPEGDEERRELANRVVSLRSVIKAKADKIALLREETTKTKQDNSIMAERIVSLRVTVDSMASEINGLRKSLAGAEDKLRKGGTAHGYVQSIEQVEKQRDEHAVTLDKIRNLLDDPRTKDWMKAYADEMSDLGRAQTLVLDLREILRQSA